MKPRYFGRAVPLAVALFLAACTSGGTSKPADTSTPPAATQPSGPAESTPASNQGADPFAVMTAKVGQTFNVTTRRPLSGFDWSTDE